MDQIIVEGVRCFQNRQVVPLRPITLLVGENSSGKTTLLALARNAWEILLREPAVRFNEDPFLLGAYDQIASFRGGRAGRAAEFTLGVALTSIPDFDTITLLNRFIQHEAQPKLAELSLETGQYRLQVLLDKAEKSPCIKVKTPSRSLSWAVDSRAGEKATDPWTILYQSFVTEERTLGKPKETSQLPFHEKHDLSRLIELFYARDLAMSDLPIAFAPVRSQPKRTYDPIKYVGTPEGSHIPMLLARLSSSQQENWGHLRKALVAFGKASGLFADVDVRHIGRKESDPFQIMVKVANSAFNLMDVGYGVSQILPIVVDAVGAIKGSTFLLQQPEVHLHPKAQAELGSFLATLAKHDQKCFVIETHSDYLVDRIRMDVRDKKLSPDDVALLYFERLNGHVEIRHLELDRFGNITNAPASYRQFFLAEEIRLLGG